MSKTIEIDKAISTLVTLGEALLVEAKEKRRKAKDATKESQDWCFHNTDEKVKGEDNHFPIYDVGVATKSVAQLKGLEKIPNWWEGEDIEKFRQKGYSKVTTKWGDKVDINKIKAKQVKKKPIR